MQTKIMKKSRWQSIVHHTGTYSLGNLLTAGISFLLIPLYTKKLSSATFGHLALLETLTIIATTLSTMGLGVAISRFYYKSDNEENQKVYVGSVVFIIITAALIITLVGWFTATLISQTWMNDSNFAGLVKLSLLSGSFAAVAGVCSQLLRIRMESAKYAISSFSLAILMLITLVYLVGFEGKGLATIVTVRTVFAGLRLLMYGILARNYIGFNIDKKKSAELVRFGLPYIPEALIWLFFASSDRYWLMRFIGAEAVGIYALGYKFASFMRSFFLQAFDAVAPIIIFAEEKQGTSLQASQQMLRYFSLFGSLIGIATILVSDLAIHFLTTSNYLGASPIVALLTFGFIMYGFNSILATGVTLSGKTWKVLIITSLCVVVSLVGYITLIPFWGGIGCALAVVLGYCAFVLTTIFMTWRDYARCHDWEHILITIIPLGICSGLYLTSNSLIYRILMDFGCMVGVILLAWFGGAIYVNEKVKIKNRSFQWIYKIGKTLKISLNLRHYQ